MNSRLLFWLILLLPFLWKCEEPNVRLDRLDPSIVARFIDVDSLIAMDEDLDLINEAITAVNDSLDVIDSLEIAGDPTDYTEITDALNEELSSLQAERSEISAQRAAVSRGTIQIERITAEGADKDIIPGEAQSEYKLPLDGSARATRFYITYKGMINEAWFTYETDTFYIDRTVRIRAKGLDLVDFDYDSARLTCDTIECSSINAKAVFYL